MRALVLASVLAAPAGAAVVREVTGLYPVEVERVARPRTVEEVRAVLRLAPGPVSVGGGRFSMGGQTATEGATQLDMRGLDRVLSVDVEKRLLTVEAGATWRKIQEHLDPLGLSVKIMQSYANFTVGGALSVNAHGRYVNQGPVARSVRALRLVRADGTVVDATPTRNRELFYAALGGYGGVAVIVEATLELEKNEPLERTAELMPVADYPAFFNSGIKGSPTAVFHNADMFPPEFDTAAAITFSRTDKAPTVADRLQPPYRPRWRDRLLYLWVSERGYAKRLRAAALAPLSLKSRPVVWRNYEASYDVLTLEPWSREKSTYVLQEYFIPVGRFGEFAPQMREVFKRHDVNVLNVSIRHAEKDPGTLLAWAREECFAFVVYYKQGTSRAERAAVEVWTRELIDAALAARGTYYLPYQWHATDEQFRRAYPRAQEFFALKKRVDPSYKLRNKLWDRYLPPPADSASDAIRARLDGRPDWRRAEAQTFLVLPEWDIVRGAEELAESMKDGRPSRFPFFASVARFWSVRAAARRAVKGVYPPNAGYQVMIGVIGVCYTVEHGLKGLYENTLGRLTERAVPTAADRALQKAAADYAGFLHHTPWYDFPFGAALREFRAASASGPWSLRKAERRAYGTVMLAAMGAWARIIKKATGAAYAPEDLTLRAWVRAPRPPRGVKLLERLGPRDFLVELPRYQAFQTAMRAVFADGGRFIELAGNPGWGGRPAALGRGLGVLARVLPAGQTPLRSRRARRAIAPGPVRLARARSAHRTCLRLLTP